MKKYIAKESGEKEAIDSNEPLKNKKQLSPKNQERQREKKQNTEPKKKKFRQNRPQYNWNREEITLETEIPQAPKKLIEKPDNGKFQDQLGAYKKQLEQLYQKRQDLIHEKNNLLKNTSENRKNGFVVRSQFSAVLKDKNNIKASIDNDIKILEEKRDIVDKDLNSIKVKINMLERPKDLEFFSTEQLKQKIQNLENRLTTADLDKKQQDSINHKINDVKRFIGRSRSQVQIEKEIALLEDEDEILYHKLKNIKQELHEKYKEVKEVRGEIAKIMQKKNEEKGNEPELRTTQEIKADYEERISKVVDQRQKVKTKLDQLKIKYNKDLDDFHDQQDLVKYIKFVTDRKKYLEERKKRKEQEQARRKREHEQRQRRKEERKKRQAERQQRLKKQREAYINRNPYHEQLDTCEYLLNYCTLLKPQHAQEINIDEKVCKQRVQLKPGNQEWDKEMKKGAEFIVGKKMKNDDEQPRKHKKDRKKKEKKQQNHERGFTYDYDVKERFEKVHILPPVAPNQVDDIIQQLKKQIDFYSNPSQEEVNKYREKAQKQFDERQNRKQVQKAQYREREGEDFQEEEIEKKARYQKKKKVQRVEQFNDQDFPELK